MKKIILFGVFYVIIFLSCATNVSATQPLPIKNQIQNFAVSIKSGDFYEWKYAGKAGEKLILRVSSSDFNPRIAVIDENGGFMAFKDEENRVVKQDDINGHVGWAILQTELPYTGNYYLQIRSENYDNKRGNVSVELGSDKSNIREDIRTDSLIVGEKYLVRELNLNQSKEARTFLANAYVKYIYEAPYCPSTVSCKRSMSPNIIISDDKDKNVDYSNMKPSDAILYLGYDKKYTFELGRQYKFGVNIHNTSNTNIPQNEFTLISVKNIDDSVVATTTLLVPDNPPVKKSFFGRIWGWFVGLFKK